LDRIAARADNTENDSGSHCGMSIAPFAASLIRSVHAAGAVAWPVSTLIVHDNTASNLNA